MPPVASTNLPMCRSVAPVKAPFSWPNRIDSTRFSGMAPQLTATNGLARRSPEPWMARAISSLPTPDSPSISTGMVEAAAFSAVRSTACIARAAGDDVLEGQRAGLAALDAVEFVLERALVQRVAQRDLQALGADRLDHEIDRARAHRRDHVVDAAVGGLHDHRHGDAGLAQPRQHAEAVEIGHHQVEHDAIEAARPTRSARDRLLAALGDHRLVAELARPCCRADDAGPDRHRR